MSQTDSTVNSADSGTTPFTFVVNISNKSILAITKLAEDNHFDGVQGIVQDAINKMVRQFSKFAMENGKAGDLLDRIKSKIDEKGGIISAISNSNANSFEELVKELGIDPKEVDDVIGKSESPFSRGKKKKDRVHVVHVSGDMGGLSDLIKKALGHDDDDDENDSNPIRSIIEQLKRNRN